MKKILVTGANGYVGAHICLILQEKGFEVIAFCRSLPQNVDNVFKNIPIIQGDLTDKNVLEKLENLDIEALVHTVSLDHHFSEKLPLEQVSETNVLATWRLAEWALEKNISKFIYLSTVQVLGKLPLEKIPENFEAMPQNRYGLTHLLCENILNGLNQKNKTNFVSLRLSNGYGSPIFTENNCWDLVINDLCRMAFKENRIVLQSDGSPLRDFIHVQDIAHTVRHLIEIEKTDFSVYQISSEETLSILELAFEVKYIFEKRYKKNISVFHSTNILVENINFVPSKYTILSKSLKNTGFGLKIGLEEGIRQIFEYLEKQNN